MSSPLENHREGSPPSGDENISPPMQRGRFSSRIKKKNSTEEILIEEAVTRHFQDLTAAKERLNSLHSAYPSLLFLPRLYKAENFRQFKVQLSVVYKNAKDWELLFEIIRDPEEAIAKRIAEPIARKDIDLVRADPAQIANWLRYYIGEKDPTKSYFSFNGTPGFHPILDTVQQEVYIQALCTWFIGSLTPLLPDEHRKVSLSFAEQGALLSKNAVMGEGDEEKLEPLKEMLEEKLKSKGKPKPKKVKDLISKELPNYRSFRMADQLDWERQRHHNSLAEDLTKDLGGMTAVIECVENIPCFHVLRAFYGWAPATFALKETYPHVEEVAIFKQKKGTPTRYAFVLEKEGFLVEHIKEYTLTRKEGGEDLAEMDVHWTLRGKYTPNSNFEGILCCKNFHFTNVDDEVRKKIYRLLFLT